MSTAEDFGLPTEEERASRVDLRHQALTAQLIDATMLHTLPPREPLVSGLMDRNALVWLQGKPGSGKSLVALDLCGHIALGRPWRGHEVHQGRVIYVVAEGASGMQHRVGAWEVGNQTHLAPQTFTFLPVAVQLLDSTDVAALRLVVTDRDPVLIVFDTQARVTVGGDENSSKDMGRLVEAADQLRLVGGATVLIVHHESRSGENMRGSTAMEGAADTAMRASKDGPLVTLSCVKQKEGPEFDPVHGSLVAAGESVYWSQNIVGLMQATTETETKILAAMWDQFETTGARSTVLLLASGVARASFYRGLGSLLRKGLLRNTGSQKVPFYVVSDRDEQLPEE